MDVSEIFNNLPDQRRADGKRYQMEFVMWLIFTSISCGNTGYRAIARFGKAHESFFTKLFNLKHGTPSHVTIGKIMANLDESKLIEKFNKCISLAEVNKSNWISGDGKSLNSTLDNVHNENQDISSIVSMYCQQTGITVMVEEFKNKKENEGEILRQLIGAFRDKGVIFTGDALHCQKKQ
jgi:PII-like signaling protein